MKLASARESRSERRTPLRRTLRKGLASTILSGASLAVFIPALAHAADAPPAADTPQATTGTGMANGMSEIVVTATHHSESLQKVAISLQALDAGKLEQNHVASFTDYATLLPSVSFETLGPGRSQPYFRGISVSGGQASTVGMYLDDIPITSPGSNPEVHVYDIERVEALSGPQGTLFGASSLAGTIRIITNKPKFDKFEFGMDMEINKWGKGDPGGSLEAYMNIPLTSNLAVRLMGFVDRTGGYINNTHGIYNYQSVPITLDNASLVKNAYNATEEHGGRAAISWEPAPDWVITPQVTYQYLNSQGGYNYDPRVGDLAVHDYSPTWLKDHWTQAELAIKGHIGDFELVSATGLFSRTYANANDYTYYSVTYDQLVAGGSVGSYYTNFTDKNGKYINPTQQYYGHEHDKKFTQEVRLSTPKSWPFQMTLGGFYQYQRYSYDDNYYIPGLSSALNSGVPDAFPPFSPAVGGVYTPDSYYLVEQDRHFKDGAFFAEGNYNVTPTVKLTGGVRYFISDNGTYGFAGTWGSADSSRAHQANGTQGCWNEDNSVLYGKFIHPSRLSCINVNTGYHETGETHKASVSWQFTPSKMVYFTYSTGFRPGGGNRLANASPYKSDTLTNFEIGWKTTWGRHFRWNAALYYEKWNGIQYVVIPPGYQGAGVTVNAGNARVYGIESDVEWRPITGLTLSANGAYNDAALSSNFCNLQSRTDLTIRSTCSTYGDDMAAAKGTRLPRQPRFKGSATVRYEFALAGTNAFLQGQVLHQSGSTSDLDVSNDALLGDTAGFTTFNFSGGTKLGKFSVEAYIENAFDNRGILSKNTFCSIQYCSGSSRSYPTKPQFFGLRVGYKY
ncbi:TonB-dependent receptor [Novosphingobium nitrogenifigens DSM 19370]|uniref:TonB-dependent receptor n=1 Tax=Novosphingobium nitrogenifigens DSM 19370 TaxID=983920 RepID=F1Z7Z7_9SPHN|nr:TonB-dependent receptor [Novosphingobium nitrogenifigens]EGD59228.1 TonB-dependent receptor [Novosphingobium nitrogenifigens DSM 19370]